MERSLDMPVNKRALMKNDFEYPDWMNQQLNPCQCCGGNPALHWAVDDRSWTSYYWGRCKCGATSPWSVDRKQAILRWNRAWGKAVPA